jgi:CDP-2,3-bis-(O-geranylgeranyl)-sn-glycerol synthase
MTIEFLQLLLLIIIANGAPIIVRTLINDSFKLAVDFGQKLPDNNPIFGPSKTWRGIFSALAVTSFTAWLIGLSIETGFMIAGYAVTGDLISSFIKRRIGMPASSMAPLLDQVPESLLPAYMMKDIFGLGIFSVFLMVLIFIITELILSHIFYKAGIRKRPY